MLIKQSGQLFSQLFSQGSWGNFLVKMLKGVCHNVDGEMVNASGFWLYSIDLIQAGVEQCTACTAQHPGKQR